MTGVTHVSAAWLTVGAIAAMIVAAAPTAWRRVRERQRAKDAQQRQALAAIRRDLEAKLADARRELAEAEAGELAARIAARLPRPALKDVLVEDGRVVDGGAR